MKQLFESLKSARKIEILVIAAMICVLLVLYMGDINPAGGASEEEKRMQRILSEIEGAGKVSVMIASRDESGISGVVVAASGADNIRVMLELQRTVQTLTGLNLDQIEIVKSRN